MVEGADHVDALQHRLGSGDRGFSVQADDKILKTVSNNGRYQQGTCVEEETKCPWYQIFQIKSKKAYLMDLAHSIEIPTPGSRNFEASFLVSKLENFELHALWRREAAVALMEVWMEEENETRSSCMGSSDFLWRLGEEDEPLFISSLLWSDEEDIEEGGLYLRGSIEQEQEDVGEFVASFLFYRARILQFSERPAGLQQKRCTKLVIN